MASSPRPPLVPRTARRMAAACVAGVAVVVALGVGAAPAVATAKPPVSIGGKVTNEGVGKVKGGAVEIEADDYYFDKTFLKAPTGSVEVTVKNEGKATHTFTIDGQDVDLQLAPGTEKTVTVDVAAGKPVVFYCKFHRTSGMQGAFFTKKGVAATSASSVSGSGGY